MNNTKAIFFDAGGTLVRPFPSVGGLYAETAERFGKRLDSNLLELEFQAAWRRRGGLASLGSEISETKERVWWHSLVSEVIQPFGTFDRFEEFFNVLYGSFEKKESWEIYPDVWSALRFFRQNNFVLGIVSNWDLRLERVMQNLGLAHRFDFMVGSSNFGVTKPDAKIFLEAARRAGVKPEEAVHIGDNYEEDFLGATSAGVTAFHLNRNGDPAQAPRDLTVTSLDEFCEKFRVPAE